MSERPNRNWEKTFVQLWQLALRDPITRNGDGSSKWQGGNQGNYSKQGGAGNTTCHKTWRDNCCWKFNRTGKCDKTDCPFDNRCSYCGAWASHSSNTCKKKLGNPSGSGGGVPRGGDHK